MIVVGYILARLFLRPIIIQRNKLNNFVKDTTHELNTPVSAIIMSLEDTNNVSERSFERIKLSAKRISEIYHDLTYLFLENDNNMPKENINVKEILDSQMEYFSTIANKKKIVVEYIADDTSLLISREDFIRLSNNLISNALKYTNKDGKIEVVLNQNSLMIKDNGIGIAKDKQVNLFKRFYRATDEVGGFGIGLNIVHNITQKYDFTIEVDSKENEGTTFIVKFV
jgi:two-component system OmpR family sensor kinase